MDISTENKRISRNTIFLYLRMLIVLIVTLYTSRVLLSILGVSDYGIYNVVAGFVSMFSFINASLNATIQRYYNYEMGRLGDIGVRNVYSNSIIIQVVLCVSLMLIVETFGSWFLYNKLNIPPDRMDAAVVVFHCSVVSMGLVILQVPFASAIVAYEKLDYYAVVGIIDIVIKLFIIIFLKYIDYDRLKLYAVLYLIVSFIIFLLYYRYTRKKLITGRIKLTFDKSLFKSMMTFSLWSIFGACAQVVRNQGLNIILNIFFGPIVNAARGLSFQVKGALSSFIANISTSVRPQLVTSYASGNTSRSWSLMTTVSKLNYILLLLLSLPVFLEVDSILHFWLGADIPEYTAIFTRLIIIVSLIDAFNGPVSMIMYASGKIGLYNIATSIAGVLVLPLAYVTLSYTHNPTLAYYSSILISILVQAVSIYVMRIKLQFSIWQYMKRIILPCFLVTIISIPLPYICHISITAPFVRFICVGIVGVISVSVTTYFLGLSNNERGYVNHFLGKVFSKLFKTKKNNNQ